MLTKTDLAALTAAANHPEGRLTPGALDPNRAHSLACQGLLEAIEGRRMVNRFNYPRVVVGHRITDAGRAAVAPAPAEAEAPAPVKVTAIRSRVAAHAAPLADGQHEREYVGDLEINIQCVSRTRSVYRVWATRHGRDTGLEHLAYVYDTESAARRAYANGRIILANRQAVAA